MKVKMNLQVSEREEDLFYKTIPEPSSIFRFCLLLKVSGCALLCVSHPDIVNHIIVAPPHHFHCPCRRCLVSRRHCPLH